MGDRGNDPSSSVSIGTTYCASSLVCKDARDMNPFLRRPVGKTRLKVPQLGMGGASLGDMRQSIPEAQATATLEAAHAAGLGYFDTSPWYGNGKSELRFGHVLRT